jgi:excisionase family DNA binding protein
MTPTAGLHTVDEVAEMVHVHPQTVYRAARLGFLKGKKVGRHWRFELADIERWVADGGRSR